MTLVTHLHASELLDAAEQIRDDDALDRDVRSVARSYLELEFVARTYAWEAARLGAVCACAAELVRDLERQLHTKSAPDV